METVGQPGTLMGIVPRLELSDQVVDLESGDTLVFYTDGVTEARTQDGFFGEERLAALIGRCAGLDAGRIVGWIERAVADLQVGNRRDDMAILALSIADPCSRAVPGGLPRPEETRDHPYREPALSMLDGACRATEGVVT